MSYSEWLKRAKDKDVREELLQIRGKDEEISDRFYKDLNFGTGGLRGIIGAGTNRMNIYTVGKATFGLAEYILKSGVSKKVAIAYDSRHKSREFAFRAAEILSSKGIDVYIFDEIMPTPVLSYAVRKLNAGAGIVITASHNPKEYNGYKVYNERGCQITDKTADDIIAEIDKSDYFAEFTPDISKIHRLGEDTLNDFLSDIRKYSLNDFTSDAHLKVVYTPLHGTGNIPVRKLLADMGVETFVVKEQELPDGDFTTCPYPNPEEKETLSIAIDYAKANKADLVLATDPDADRIGIAVRNENNEYILLNGNETGVLLMSYILSQKKQKGISGKEPTVIKTIVTTDMVFDIAKTYGANVKEVLTGFKYIGEEIDVTDNYVLGMEESYGYLVGAHVRDKDAVSAAMMIVEMCAFYKTQGITLLQALDELYQTYGFYKTDLQSIAYPGQEGMATMNEVIDDIRKNPPREIVGEQVIFKDFIKGVSGLPKSNVLRFRGENIRLIIRPSGTEPKLKIYYQVKGETEEKAAVKMRELKFYAKEKLNIR